MVIVIVTAQFVSDDCTNIVVPKGCFGRYRTVPLGADVEVCECVVLGALSCVRFPQPGGGRVPGYINCFG